MLDFRVNKIVATSVLRSGCNNLYLLLATLPFEEWHMPKCVAYTQYTGSLCLDCSFAILPNSFHYVPQSILCSVKRFVTQVDVFWNEQPSN